MLLKKFKAGLFFTIFCSVWACSKKTDVIPNMFVNQYVYVNNPTNFKLNAIGGWIYLTGGVRGIILYRKSSDEFIAYERNCTWQPNDACATLSVDSTNVSISDHCCSSKFVIMDGSIQQGPATIPLRRYQAAFDGSVIHVFN